MEDFDDTEADTEVIPESKPFRQRFRSKDPQRGDVPLEVVFKKRRGKCLGSAFIPCCSIESMVENCTISYNIISNDIWLHISEHVHPEDVKTFALICRQTAEIVKSRQFWRHVLRKYCSNVTESDSVLPDYLRDRSIRSYGAKTLRCHTIQLLFYLYKPLVDRIELGYNLDCLIGRSFVSSWHKKSPCNWIMCYKFWNHLKNEKRTNEVQTVDDWESLLNENLLNRNDDGNPFEGVFLLAIGSNTYIPFPTQLLYDTQNEEGHTRLIATRQLLSKDIRSTNLELDFQNPLHNIVTTVRYPSVFKFKVIPWWHPSFRAFTS